MKKLLLIITLCSSFLAQAMEPIEEPIQSPNTALAGAQEQLSVQDLIDRNELPAIDEFGTLDLGTKGLTSLLGLENVPNPDQITSLYLDENKIVYIPDNAFDKFINLTALNLTNNPIIEVQPHLLDMLVNLEELHLEGANIVAIPPHFLDNLRQLKVLHLFKNKLDSLPVKALHNLRNLEEFDIQNNNLIALDPDSLSNQIKLERLFLNRNKITQLPKITHLTKLKAVHLANNPEITELSPEVIAFILQHKIGFDMPELLGEIPEYSAGQLVADLGDNWQDILIVHDPITGDLVLNLDNRGLTDLSGLPQEISGIPISKISAKNNFIKRIPSDFFIRTINAGEQGMQTLHMFNGHHLDLSNNMIETLFVTSQIWGGGGILTAPLQLDKYCPFLAEINLNANKITKIPNGVFNGLRKLEILELNDNLITSIDDGAFNDLGNLITLSLEHNRLHILQKNLFKNLYKLEYLYLFDNNLGNKEQYVFPPNTAVKFYPQAIPMLKLLAAKKVANGLEGKNVIEVYKIFQTIPEDMHEAILTAASKNVARKISYANRINPLLNLLAQNPGLINTNLFKLWPKDMEDAILAIAPESLRPKLIEIGFGSRTPGRPKQQQFFGQKLAEEPEESEEEMTLGFMDEE